MKRVMSDRMQQLLRDPDAARKLRLLLQGEMSEPTASRASLTYRDATNRPVEVHPRLINVG